MIWETIGLATSSLSRLESFDVRQYAQAVLEDASAVDHLLR
jgi:hypothetical protein